MSPDLGREAEIERLQRRLRHLEEMLGPLPGRVIFRQSVKTIVDMAAEIWGVSSRDIVGPLRASILTEPRFAVYWVARHTLPLSLPQIGRAMGGRDHTTIMHGLRRADRLRLRCRDFQRYTDAMVAALEQEREADRRAIAEAAAASPELALEVAA